MVAEKLVRNTPIAENDQANIFDSLLQEGKWRYGCW
jgi:hypothetical protein